MLLFPFAGGPAADSQFSDSLMIYLGLESPDVEILDNEFDHWTNSNVPPPIIIVVGEDACMKSLCSKPKTAIGRIPGLDRLYKHSDVHFAGFDASGIIRLIDNNNTQVEITKIFNAAVEAYIAQQIQESDVVIPAPPSIFFDKLSGRYASHFIRAEALLQCTSSIEILALRLLKSFNDWHERFKQLTSNEIDIYLDTMSIWPVAEKLTQLHRVGKNNEIRYRIQSFKSYGGLEDWDPPDRPAFVIISATTSGGLSTKIEKKITGTQAAIWTLLTLSPQQRDPNAVSPSNSGYVYEIPRKLVGRPALEGLRGDFQTEFDSLPADAETISIVGERFLNQPVKPKRVRLVHTSLKDELKEQLPLIATHNMVIAAQAKYDTQSRWSISFDMERLFAYVLQPEKSGVESLLSKYLAEQDLSANIVVIYPSVESGGRAEIALSGKNFANGIVETLQNNIPNIQCFAIHGDELADVESKKLANLGDDWSAIVAAPIIGNGFVFKQISALLRSRQPRGKRLFLAIAALPETQAIYDQLLSDLTLVDRNLYRFKCYFPIPIGRLDTVINWGRELKILRELRDVMEQANIVSESVEQRTALLEGYEPLTGERVFLPTADGKPLPLSPTFALWENSREIEGDAYGGEVLLSVAAFLQAIRSTTTKVETSLKTGLFQHALICPESFTRYNDGIIQAAILRAANASELNYSVSPDMSRDMKRLMLKWMTYAKHPAGAAAGEFLLAMALRKLKLRDEDAKEVIACAKNIDGWVGCLAQVAENNLFRHT